MTDPLAEELCRGRLPGAPIAIIDIGSNSVRLVIFERASRSPVTLFNEKLQAGLGRGVSSSGRLEDAAVQRALTAIERFKLLCSNARVESIHVIATAAVREAENGAEFVAEVERHVGGKVSVLSGREEAYYAALGVIAGLWQPRGLAADMGGGSLELVDVDGTSAGVGRTFALGALRLQEDAGGKVSEAIRIADRVLRDEMPSKAANDMPLYLIGGTWRSLAKLHMAERGYPIRVMQAYKMPAAELLAFCERLTEEDLADNPHIDAVSRSRRGLLPYGAAVLMSLLDHTGASSAVISAYGVREGYVYSTLDADLRADDPLHAGCLELAQLRARSLTHVAELTAWTDQLVDAVGIEEDDYQKRLRHAACLLADIGWRGHPDHRGDASLSDIAHAALAGVDHAGRAFLALTIYYRYAGLAEPEIAMERAYLDLLPKDMIGRLRTLASGMRLAYVLSASMPGTLGACRIERGLNGAIQIVVPEKFAALDGERLRKRATHLTREVGMPVEVRVDTDGS